MKKQWLEEVNIYRALIVMWVVIGHSYEATLYPTFFGFVKEYAYIFHMSAFFVISGFLFYKSRQIQSSTEAFFVLTKKAQRLLIPYWFCSITTLLAKALLENYAKNPIRWRTLALDLLLGINNPNGGVWFLHTLFILSLLAIIFGRIPKKIVLFFSVTLKICAFFGFFKGIPIVDRIAEYSVFYFGGMFLYPHYKKIKEYTGRLLNEYAVIKITLFLLISIVVSYLSIYHFNNMPLFTFSVTIYNIYVYYMIALRILKKQVGKSIFNTVGSYGMDIYIIGYYVQNGIYVLLGQILHMPYVLYSQFMCLCGLIMPVLISKYFVRKIKLTRMLVLGDLKK